MRIRKLSNYLKYLKSQIEEKSRKVTLSYVGVLNPNKTKKNNKDKIIDTKTAILKAKQTRLGTKIFFDYFQISTVDRRLTKCFNQWHLISIKEKIYTVEKLVQEFLFQKYYIGVMTNFVFSLRHLIKQYFQTFMTNSLKKIVHNTQIQTLHNNLLYFENIYDHKLLNNLHAFYNMTYRIEYKKNEVMDLIYQGYKQKKHWKYIVISKFMSIWKLSSMTILKHKILARKPFFLFFLILEELFERKLQFYTFSLLKERFIWSYGIIQEKILKFIKILSNMEIRLKTQNKEKYFGILKMFQSNDCIRENLEYKGKFQLFITILKNYSFLHKKNNFRLFVRKIHFILAQSETIQYGLLYTKFVHSLNRRVVKFQTKEVFSKIREKILNSKTIKTIDSLIISNTAMINLNMMEELIKKTQNLKLLRYKKISSIIERKIKKTSQNVVLKKRFSLWKNKIIEEKIQLLEDIKNQREFNVKFS
jgi:hypothetical protein